MGQINSNYEKYQVYWRKNACSNVEYCKLLLLILNL